MNWYYSYSHDIWPALITLALVVYLGSYSWQRRYIPAAKPFTMACFLSVFWTLGVILELLSVDFSTKVFWVKFQAIWPLPVGCTVNWFILEFAGLGRLLTRRSYLLLSVVPLLSVLAVLTNDFHHLMWTGFHMNEYVSATSGSLYWFFNSYIFLLGIINLVVLVRLAIVSPRHRLPVAIILSAQMIARAVYTMDKVETDLLGPGETLFFVVGLMAVSYALAFLRFHAIDPVPAARAAVLDQMSEGLIVLDLQGRIADVNPRTTEILQIPSDSLRQKNLGEVMNVDTGILQVLASKETGQTDITLGNDDPVRQYSLSWSRLKGRQGELVGKLLLLHDVTEQKQAQAEIVKHQSMVAALREREHLAHELHDGIGQIFGYVSMQVQAALKRLHDGNREKAVHILKRIMEVTKDAHADLRESIFNLKTTSAPQRCFIANLKKYVDRFSTNYGIRTELLPCQGIDRNLFDPAAELELLRVIQEAMTNSRKHSGAQSLKVNIELDTHKALITITDDGSGFDVQEINGCDGGHFGLVFMRERMAKIGGSLSVDSSRERGTVLILEAPICNREAKSA